MKSQRYSSSLIKINCFDTRINYQVKKKIKLLRNNESNNLIIIPDNSYFDILPSNGFIERSFRPYFLSYSFYYYLKFYFFISIIFFKNYVRGTIFGTTCYMVSCCTKLCQKLCP